MKIGDLALIALLIVTFVAIFCLGWTLYQAAYDLGRSEPYWGAWDIVVDLEECTVTIYEPDLRNAHTWIIDRDVVDDYLRQHTPHAMG